jgi:Domain of unknown function (DUF1840)
MKSCREMTNYSRASNSGVVVSVRGSVVDMRFHALQRAGEKKSDRHRSDGEPAVSLPHRALPLIDLLKAAAKAKCDVMWDKNN